MNEYIIPIKGVISSTVKVQAASLEKAIEHALANPPESDFAVADFDGVDEWLLSGGHYVDREHVADEPTEESFAGPAPATLERSPQVKAIYDNLATLLEQLGGEPVAIALVSATGNHTVAAWGGTTDTNIKAMVNATATVAMATEESLARTAEKQAK